MQPLFEITVNPIDLSEYGKTPKGKPLYRVVWSDTRLMKVRYAGKTHELPMYGHLAGKWIMERWLPAEQVMGMSREAFDILVRDQKLPECSYPIDGEYEFVMAFPQEVVPGVAHKTIQMIEFQRNNLTAKDRKAINDESELQKAKDVDRKKSLILENAMDRPNEIVKSAAFSLPPETESATETNHATVQ